jgi:hypothetical protein
MWITRNKGPKGLEFISLENGITTEADWTFWLCGYQAEQANLTFPFYIDFKDDGTAEILPKAKLLIDSDSIIKEIQLGIFDYDCLGVERFNDDYTSIKLNERTHGNDKHKMCITIDTTMDINIIIDEVRHAVAINEWAHSHKGIRIGNFKDIATEHNFKYDELIEQFHYKQERKLHPSIKRITLNSECRAIGLWLWDYTKYKNIPWKSRANAYFAFHERYHNTHGSDIYIDGYKSDKQLAELLEATNECIEKMEVLPMG